MRRSPGSLLKPFIYALAIEDGLIHPQSLLRDARLSFGIYTPENTDSEFLLVATSLANPEVVLMNERLREPGEDPRSMDHRSFAGNQADYLPALLSLEKKGVAVADMTSLHAYMLERKRFRDMSGNNINHPNDFFARIHAQLMIATLSNKPEVLL